MQRGGAGRQGEFSARSQALRVSQRKGGAPRHAPTTKHSDSPCACSTCGGGLSTEQLPNREASDVRRQRPANEMRQQGQEASSHEIKGGAGRPHAATEARAWSEARASLRSARKSGVGYHELPIASHWPQISFRLLWTRLTCCGVVIGDEAAHHVCSRSLRGGRIPRPLTI